MTVRRQNESWRQRAARPHRSQAQRSDCGANPGVTSTTRDARAEMLVAADPALRNYLRAPYDPTYGIAATSAVTRGILSAASAGGPRQIGAAIVMLIMAFGGVAGLALAVRAVTLRDGFWIVNGLWAVLFAFVFGTFALALARRLWPLRRAS